MNRHSNFDPEHLKLPVRLTHESDLHSNTVRRRAHSTETKRQEEDRVSDQQGIEASGILPREIFNRPTSRNSSDQQQTPKLSRLSSSITFNGYSFKEDNTQRNSFASTPVNRQKSTETTQLMQQSIPHLLKDLIQEGAPDKELNMRDQQWLMLIKQLFLQEKTQQESDDKGVLDTIQRLLENKRLGKKVNLDRSIDTEMDTVIEQSTPSKPKETDLGGSYERINYDSHDRKQLQTSHYKASSHTTPDKALFRPLTSGFDQYSTIPSESSKSKVPHQSLSSKQVILIDTSASAKNRGRGKSDYASYNPELIPQRLSMNSNFASNISPPLFVHKSGPYKDLISDCQITKQGVSPQNKLFPIKITGRNSVSPLFAQKANKTTNQQLRPSLQAYISPVMIKKPKPLCVGENRSPMFQPQRFKSDSMHVMNRTSQLFPITHGNSQQEQLIQKHAKKVVVTTQSGNSSDREYANDDDDTDEHFISKQQNEATRLIVGKNDSNSKNISLLSSVDRNQPQNYANWFKTFVSPIQNEKHAATLTKTISPAEQQPICSSFQTKPTSDKGVKNRLASYSDYFSLHKIKQSTISLTNDLINTSKHFQDVVVVEIDEKTAELRMRKREEDTLNLDFTNEQETLPLKSLKSPKQKITQAKPTSARNNPKSTIVDPILHSSEKIKKSLLIRPSIPVNKGMNTTQSAASIFSHALKQHEQISSVRMGGGGPVQHSPLFAPGHLKKQKSLSKRKGLKDYLL